LFVSYDLIFVVPSAIMFCSRQSIRLHHQNVFNMFKHYSA
jgi:ketosteroid isomerase-like protein